MNSFLRVIVVILGATMALSDAQAKGLSSAVESVQRNAEHQIKSLLEPLIEKYCHDECKLMSVTATVDLVTPDELAPGFDDVDPRGAAKLAPSSARIKMLMDEKIGPVSRTKMLELIQQYLDTMDYPVKIETQLAHFPQPLGAAGKIAERRDRVSKQFRASVDDLFRQFCPDHCMLADFELHTEQVNPEEAQYGAPGEFIEEGGIAIRIKQISGTILTDEEMEATERTNVLEMARLKTNFFKNVDLQMKNLKFPRPGSMGAEGNGLQTSRANRFGRGLASSTSSEHKGDHKSESSHTSSSDSRNTFATNSQNTNTSTNNESQQRQERFERIEKIERVESGDAVQAELQKFKVFGLIFSCSIISMLLFILMATLRPARSGGQSAISRVVQQLTSDPVSTAAPSTYKPGDGSGGTGSEERAALLAKRYEVERLYEEMMTLFSEQPKVAKQVFSRVLAEEGVEVTAQYMQIFGETIVVDMLRDPSLQADVTELTEFYAKNPMDLKDDEKSDLLKKLYNRAIAGKLLVMGSRASSQFDFLADMDGTQILELIRNESLTVKAIVMTQSDTSKRQQIYTHLDEGTRMKLLTELSRIDYLPRDYIANVANALKRKRRENPRLNTEALPGSEVLLTLLERSGADMQKVVVKNLELSNPETARAIKSKLVSIDTLKHLRDGQLLEVVLSLRHDELLQFLKGASDSTKAAVMTKAPKELSSELEEELGVIDNVSREAYQNVERKILNRMKIMANEGLINLVETNERMLTEGGGGSFVEAGPASGHSGDGDGTMTGIKKAAGW